MRLKTTVGLYLLLLFAAAAIVGCSTKGIDFESGLTKYEAGDLDGAIKVFQSIAEGKNKYSNRARFYIGECYKLQFKWDQAIAQFQMVSDAEPANSFLASEARNRISQISEGRKDIQRIKITHDNYPGTDQAADALLELGSVYENKLNDYRNAIKTYEQLLVEFPGSSRAAQAQYNIGSIYFYRLYDYTTGWKEFQKINEKTYPNMKFRVSEVEDLLRNTNKLLGEIRDQLAFIKQAEKRKIAEGRRVTGYERYGDQRETVAQGFLAVGKKWRELRNYPKAIEAYRTLVFRLPLMLRQVAEARFSIAEIYHLDQGRFLDAIDAYEEYITKHPTDYKRDEAIYNVAICYDALRDYEKSYEYYKIYRDTYPEGKFYKAAELKVRQYEYDEDQDGYPYYKEAAAGTPDTDASKHP